MGAKHHLTQAEEVYTGKARYSRAYSRNGRPGVKITPELLFHSFGAISTADADGVSASQAVNTPASALINGALASGGVATFSTPRNVVAAWTGAAVLTIVGTDEYGSIITEVSASGTSHTGKKAFKTVTSVTPSANVTGLTVGEGVVIGLPIRVDENGLLSTQMDGAHDTTRTFVEADATDPATGTTGDVRGTVTFASAPNGSRNYAVLLKAGNPSTKVGAYGVKQFGSSDSA